MSRPSFVLGTALLLLTLVSCDREYEPGIDHFLDTFATAPHATRVDTHRDSVSEGQRAYIPVGTTSGARSVAEARSSRPYGEQNTSEYTDSGTTDGTSTTSGYSLTNRGSSKTVIIPGTTSGAQNGNGNGGNGTSGPGNSKNQDAKPNTGSQKQLGNTSPQSTNNNENVNKSNNN